MIHPNEPKLDELEKIYDQLIAKERPDAGDFKKIAAIRVQIKKACEGREMSAIKRPRIGVHICPLDQGIIIDFTRSRDRTVWHAITPQQTVRLSAKLIAAAQQYDRWRILYGRQYRKHRRSVALRLANAQ